MDQSVRHNLLSSLGVKSWYCKYTLQNAASTPIDAFPKVKPIESFAAKAISLSKVSSSQEILADAQLIIGPKLDLDVAILP